MFHKNILLLSNVPPTNDQWHGGGTGRKQSEGSDALLRTWTSIFPRQHRHFHRHLTNATPEFRHVGCGTYPEIQIVGLES